VGYERKISISNPSPLKRNQVNSVYRFMKMR
jgi:hypothetical protein